MTTTLDYVEAVGLEWGCQLNLRADELEADGQRARARVLRDMAQKTGRLVIDIRHEQVQEQAPEQVQSAGPPHLTVVRGML